jgi:hypothetical protein
MSWGSVHGDFEDNVKKGHWNERSEVVVNSTELGAESSCVFETFCNNWFVACW